MAPTFAELGVPEPIAEVLARQRIHSPFAIQAATIPELLTGRDVVARAPTGSGKTLAFGLPMIAMVGEAEPRRPHALVLAPTRELAEQIATELSPAAASLGRRILSVYGGVGIEPQIKKLRRGIDILVATPGRLEDLIERRAVSLDHAAIVVLDEADRMADMGFMPAVKRLLAHTPEERQTVLFSATLDGDVATLINRYQRDPSRHEVGPATPDLEAMQHHFWELPRPERIALCASVIATFGPTIVFTRTRHGADRAARQLSRHGIKAVAIHGNRSQAQRTRALDDFSSGRAHALVATDVAARGIHVDGVECVVHFDPVDEDSAYIHRSGRTARAGARGHVVSFVDPAQMKAVKAMKRRLGLPQEVEPPPPLDGAPLPELSDDDRRDDRRPDRGRPPAARRSGSAKRSTGRGKGSGNGKGAPKGKRRRRPPAKGSSGRPPAKGSGGGAAPAKNRARNSGGNAKRAPSGQRRR